MPGKIYRVIPKTLYDYSLVLGMDRPTGRASDWIARGIDVSSYRELTLLVRVHASIQTLSSNLSVQVIVYQDGPTSEDPFSEFYGSTLCTSGALALSSATPALAVASFTTPPMGGYVRVYLYAAQNGSATTGFTAATFLSVDLVGKS